MDNKELNELIKTYEPILVDVDKLPEIDTNKIISVSSFEKLVDVNIENPTTPIMDRTAVTREFLTGITGIDLMYPIGKGQRQLIIGDKNE